MKKWPQCYAINVPRPPRPRAVFVIDVPRLPAARHLQRFCRVRRCTRRSTVIKIPHYCKSPAIHLPYASPPQLSTPATVQPATSDCRHYLFQRHLNQSWLFFVRPASPLIQLSKPRVHTSTYIPGEVRFSFFNIAVSTPWCAKRHHGLDVGRSNLQPLTDADGPCRPRVCRRPSGQPIAAVGQPSAASSSINIIL